MYVVIKTGGKQYRVTKGEILQVEKLEAETGASVEFDTVLMIGAPCIEGARVTATVKSQGRSPKVLIVKFRRRKHYRKTQGHRQSYTELQISGISG